MSATIKKVTVITTAAMLLGNDRDSVDPEYSRAIAELVNELTGIGSADDVEATETMLWAIATGEESGKCPVCGEIGYTDPEECSFCLNQK